MLVLSREAGQRIKLDIGRGRTITLAYLGMRGGAGRIGIDAPDDVRILREELKDDGRERRGLD